MNSYRKYGIEPNKVSVIHGGPGAPGYMKPVAEELSEICGIIEPLQSESTIDGLIHELKEILERECSLPVTLLGHSWGAWLSIIFTYENPDFIKKIILTSSGPFEDEYSQNINSTRISRLSEREVEELNMLKENLNNPDAGNKKESFKRFGDISSKADYYKQVDFSNYILDYQPDIFQTVMREAIYLRKSGKLLKMAGRLNCPVIAVHGDYDPHPYKGVEEPLSKAVKDFRFILLKDCGHYPWNEVYAKEKFYKIIKKEL